MNLMNISTNCELSWKSAKINKLVKWNRRHVQKKTLLMTSLLLKKC